LKLVSLPETRDGTALRNIVRLVATDQLFKLLGEQPTNRGSFAGGQNLSLADYSPVQLECDVRIHAK